MVLAMKSQSLDLCCLCYSFGMAGCNRLESCMRCPNRKNCSAQRYCIWHQRRPRLLSHQTFSLCLDHVTFILMSQGGEWAIIGAICGYLHTDSYLVCKYRMQKHITKGKINSHEGCRCSGLSVRISLGSYRLCKVSKLATESSKLKLVEFTAIHLNFCPLPPAAMDSCRKF